MDLYRHVLYAGYILSGILHAVSILVSLLSSWPQMRVDISTHAIIKARRCYGAY